MSPGRDAGTAARPGPLNPVLAGMAEYPFVILGRQR